MNTPANKIGLLLFVGLIVIGIGLVFQSAAAYALDPTHAQQPRPFGFQDNDAPERPTLDPSVTATVQPSATPTSIPQPATVTPSPTSTAVVTATATATATPRPTSTPEPDPGDDNNDDGGGGGGGSSVSRVSDAALISQKSIIVAGVGDYVEIAYIVTNVGNTVARDVTVTDRLPSFLSLVEATTSWGEVDFDAQSAVVTVDAVHPDDQVLVRLVVHVTGDAVPPDNYNTAVLASGSGDDNMGNNRATALIWTITP
ncbi:MAG: DUF11 domain-containing protein [Chloroflexaceae bacterium]|nr:DUF11 domain-containing protein [Chloroflexaceae bacterium]